MGIGIMRAMELGRRPLELLTVGHSNRSLDHFLGLLRAHAVSVLVDVRSHPNSTYLPHFEQAQLRVAMRAAGIDYLFLGRELGGRPEGVQYYDDEGYVKYGRRAVSPEFKAGLSRLAAGIAKYRVAVMCSEENPDCCHRRLLVGRALIQEYSIRLVHIRGSGNLETEVNAAVPATDSGSQMSLFSRPTEDAWKSARPLSRYDRPARTSVR